MQLKLPKHRIYPWENHKVISAAASLALPFFVYAFSYSNPIFRFIVPGFILLVGLVEYFSWGTFAHLHEGRTWAVVRSSLFYLAWVLLFFLLPNQAFQVIFLLSSIPVLYLAQELVGYTGETVLITHTILTSFGLLLAAAAGEYYFHAGSFLLTLLVFMSLFLLVRATYVFVPQPSSIRLACSLVVALLATQSYAALLFLPFHFSVVGFFAFLAFYLAWLFSYYWQFGVLNSQRVKFYVIVSALLVVGLLLATPWRIVS
jgi:hypothetical protein